MTRVAAIDLGRVRIGIAVSDELGLLAHARPHLNARSRKVVLQKLAELAKSEGITRYLVGFPLNMSGERGVAADRAIRFCQQVANATGVEVELIDERLTSVQAERELAAGGADRAEIAKKVDGVAAAIILQQWLDAQRSPAADNDDG
jgi:putative Holliday junction resolvase